MKKLIIVATALGLGFASLPSHAISHAYRAKLERSGCTEVTSNNGTCDINKTKAQNLHKQVQSLPAIAADVESLVDEPVSEAVDHLIAEGWKANNGVWKKGKYILKLVVEDDTVVNAQLTK